MYDIYKRHLQSKCFLERKDEILVFTNFTSLVLISTLVFSFSNNSKMTKRQIRVRYAGFLTLRSIFKDTTDMN